MPLRRYCRHRYRDDQQVSEHPEQIQDGAVAETTVTHEGTLEVPEIVRMAFIAASLGQLADLARIEALKCPRAIRQGGAFLSTSDPDHSAISSGTLPI